MGLFDPVRGMLGGGDDESSAPDDEPESVLPPEHREPTPTNFRNMAVDAVQDWEDLDLDFSLESLERLDAFAKRQTAKLELIRDEQGDAAASEAHTAFTLQAGSYFGETLYRLFHGRWVKNGERWAVEVPGEDDSSKVHIFEVAAHSFAEQPAFAEMARELGPDEMDTADADDDEGTTTETADAGADVRPEAESFAHSWSGYDLDFSADSLVRLETLAAEEWDRSRFHDATVGGDGMDSKMYTKLVKQLGAYYGEVLVRTLDGEWTHRGDELVVGVTGEARTTEAVFDVAAAALESDPEFVTRYRRVAQAAQRPAPEIDTEQARTDAAGTAPTGVDDDPAQPEDEPPADQPTDQPRTGQQPPESRAEQPADEPAVGHSTAESTTDDQSTGYEPTPDRPSPSDEGDESDDPLEGTPLEGEPEAPGDADQEPTGAPADEVATDSRDQSGEQPPSQAAPDRQPPTQGSPDQQLPSQTSPDEQSPAQQPAVERQQDTQSTDDQQEPDPSVLGEPTAQPSESPSEPAPPGPPTSETAETDGQPQRHPQAKSGDQPQSGSNDPETAQPETTSEQPAGDDPDSAEPDVDAVAAELAEKADAGPGGNRVKTIDELREDAAAFAATWPGYDLDYSPESLQRLDDLVADEYETDADTDTEFLTDRAAEAGGYFAEVLYRTLGAEWVAEPAPEIVVEGRVDQKQLDPVSLAISCFEGRSSFASTYATIQRELSLSVTDHERS